MSFDIKNFKPDEFEECPKHGRYVKSGMCNGHRYTIPNCPGCRSYAKKKALIKNTSVPKNTEHCTFENYIITSGTDEQKQVLETCINYAENFESDISKSPSIFMLGNKGTGKNHLSTAIVKVISLKRFTALHMQGIDYLDLYHGKAFQERPSWIRKLSEIDLLVLDEVEKTPRTKGSDDAYFRIIQSRTMAMKPTIVLSNSSYEELPGVITSPGVDRLKDYDGIGLNFNWKSFRGKRK